MTVEGEAMPGGNTAPVVRLGDTVRRVTGPWTPNVAALVARAVRVVHDATTGLDLPLTGWRRPAVEPVEAVRHGDVAPYNCVFSDGHVVALIDWDYALPGPRLRGLGMAAYRFVSLTPPGHPDGASTWSAGRCLHLEDLWHPEDLVHHAAARAAAGRGPSRRGVNCRPRR